MDFSRQQHDPARNLAGIAGVILLHIALVYALMSGLARKAVEAVKEPIVNVELIEEIVRKPPPPPLPENPRPPPPRVAVRPPPSAPPPEIQSAPPPAPAISAIAAETPPVPQALAPQEGSPAPPADAPPVKSASTSLIPSAPSAPAAVQNAAVVCPNYRQVMSRIVYPREALRAGLQGEVIVEFTVTGNGRIRDPAIRSSTHRVFNRASLAAIADLQCQGQGRDLTVQAPIGFRLD
jgi:protein TonB